MKKRFLVISACAALVLLAGAAALFFALYSRQVWLVDADFVGDWTAILKNRSAPFTTIEVYTGTIPKRARGFIITTKLPQPPASLFPVKSGWNSYGIEAALLWSEPFGSEWGRKWLGAAAKWLAKSETQTMIAGEMEWVPVSRPGVKLTLRSEDEKRNGHL
jgi:hypothetical protein